MVWLVKRITIASTVETKTSSVTKAKMGGPEIDIDGLELGQIVDAQTS